MQAQYVNVGKPDAIKFERNDEIGVTLTTPNGNSIFLTDDMLDQLFDFQRDCLIAEAKSWVHAVELDGEVK